MMIKNESGTPQDFTVIVNYGDIGGTTSPVVERIWYVKSAAGKATMKLFFTKRVATGWPSGENEVESGFDYAQAALIQKDYAGNTINLSRSADIQNFLSAGTYPYNTEVYGVYTIGMSNNFTDGIQQFNRFSITNPINIILPVTVLDFNAYREGKLVQLDWIAHNETNVDHYEIQRSANGNDFITLGSLTGLDNSSDSKYSYEDRQPLGGDNFYRLKIVDKDGKVNYSAIKIVNLAVEKGAITIYPNPVLNKMFNLQLNNMPQGKYELVVYNGLGQKLLAKTIEHGGGSATEQVILGVNILPGSYFVKIYNESTSFTSHLVVQ
jgi:hypothetical protein